eukprot:4691071-Heterocapsa_arctica.AAC.1
MEAGPPRVPPHAGRSGVRTLQPHLRPGASGQCKQKQVPYLGPVGFGRKRDHRGPPVGQLSGQAAHDLETRQRRSRG